MEFKEFAKQKGLQEKLPFDLDFEVEPDFGDQPTEKVAGFNIPKFNELLSREVWFSEMLGAQIGNRRQDLQMAFLELADKLKNQVNEKLEQHGKKDRVEYLNDALSLLQNSLPDDCENPKNRESKQRKQFFEWLLDSQLYKEFLVHHNDEFNKISELAQNVEGDLTINWLKVSFFMLSRYSGEWTLGKTAALPTSKINEIIKFIERETNGGKEPEQPQPSEQEEEDVGKL